MLSVIKRNNGTILITAFLIALLVAPLLLQCCLSSSAVSAFTCHSHRHLKQKHIQVSATTSTNDNHSADTVQFSKCSGSQQDIASVGRFMVDAFWLRSSPSQSLIVQNEQDQDDVISTATTTVILPESTRSNLITEQVHDLMEAYGERLGTRLLNSCLWTAFDDDTDDNDGNEQRLLGVVGIEVCLWNKASNEIIGATKGAENMVKNAVASLGPKQRRQYKDSSVKELATELLPPEMEAICCLSNLCVSPHARRRGIANKLCRKVEETAMEWGYNEMFLKVERENREARYLYENRLGYQQQCVLKDEVALRVDVDSGFVETTADTIILRKQL